MRLENRTGARTCIGLTVAATIVLTVLAFTILTAARAQLAKSVWPMFQQNLKHTGLSPVDTSSNTGSLKWKFTTGGITYSSPAVGADGTIYIGSADDNLYAINPAGSQKWKFTTGNLVYSSPAVGADGIIYVGSADDNLYAINADGTLKWKFTTGASLYTSSPAVGTDGTIYVGSDDSNLYAINPDGSQKWKFATGSSVGSSPAVGTDGTIYVGSDDSNLYAINPDGSQKWKFTTGSSVESSPAVGADGTIYVGSDDDNLYAIDPGGSLKWKFATSSVVQFSPALGADGTIYIGSFDHYLYAINPDGSQKWKFNAGDPVESPAVGADGTIYIGSSDHNLYAINPDGSQKWKFTTESVVYSSPAVGVDATIYIGSYFGDLYALGGKPSPTATASPKRTPTPIPTRTAPPTSIPTPITTNTPIATPTLTPTPTRSPTPTPTAPECIATTPKPTVPTPTPTPVPGHPHISSVQSPVLAGASFVINGSGFTKGSEVNFFISTSSGPVNKGPLKPDAATLSASKLTVPVPATIPLGQGFVSVVVVNTDEGFVQSNAGFALLQGSAAAGLPSIIGLDGDPLAASSLDPGYAVTNVETTLVQGSPMVIDGDGFDTIHGVGVNVFCACPKAGGKVTQFLIPGNPGLKSDSITFPLPAAATTGPGSIIVSNFAGGTYSAKSNAVSVPLGTRINVTKVTQSGDTLTVDGTGFSTRTVINLFNAQAGKTTNLGGLNSHGAAKIPLTLVSSTEFTFTVPADAVAGPAFIEALNPPFLTYTSSGNNPCGVFTLE